MVCVILQGFVIESKNVSDFSVYAFGVFVD